MQFNLKNLIPERIVSHLSHVLGEENISFEEPALWLLARSADGSMRDAMSLTDQAIAFGAGAINEADVRAMLGTIDQRLVYQMLDCLAAGDAKALMAAVTDLAQFSPDYNTVLGDLLSVLHRIALAQTIPDAVDNSMGDMIQVQALAGTLSAEDIQLYYQVALMGRKDLPFVPDPREGLEMVLLRMLAFRPAGAKPRTVALNSESVAVSTPPVNEEVKQPDSALPVPKGDVSSSVLEASHTEAVLKEQPEPVSPPQPVEPEPQYEDVQAAHSSQPSGDYHQEPPAYYDEGMTWLRR